MPDKIPLVDFAENKNDNRSAPVIDSTQSDAGIDRMGDPLSFAPSKNIYVDMDGVLAVFNQVESEEVLMQKGYYAGLDPQMNVVNAVKDLAKRNDVRVFVLSAVLPSPYAREEKDAWLDRYLPEVDDAHRIFLPCGDDKSRYIGHTPDKTDLLLDDYSKNLLEWSPPGKAVKLMNNINGNFGTWKGERISMDLPPRVIEAKLLNCLDIQHNLGKDSVSFEITGCEVHSGPVETMGDDDPRTANFPVSTDYDPDSDLGLRKGSTRMWVEYCPVPGKEQVALYYKNPLKSYVQEFSLSDKQKGELKNAVEAYCESKYGRNALSWIEASLEAGEKIDSAIAGGEFYISGCESLLFGEPNNPEFRAVSSVAFDFDADSIFGTKPGDTEFKIIYSPFSPPDLDGKHPVELRYKNSLAGEVRYNLSSDRLVQMREKQILSEAMETFCEDEYHTDVRRLLKSAEKEYWESRIESQNKVDNDKSEYLLNAVRAFQDEDLKDFEAGVDREIDNILSGRAQERKDKTPIRESTPEPQGKNGIAGYVEAFGKKSGKNGSKNIGRG